MNYRLRGFFRGLLRLALIALGLGMFYLGWRAFLHFGPGTLGGPGAPAMYLFHAKALIRARMAFPRPAPPVFLPTPQPLSSADVQLRLMKWRDGKNWLPEALTRGESVKGGLQLQAGQLVLTEVIGVTPPQVKDGAATCAVRVKVRWDFPENLQEMHRVKDIVGLRFAKGLVPGEVGEMTCTFTRQGWRWELVSAEAPWGGKMPLTAQTPGVLNWVF